MIAPPLAREPLHGGAQQRRRDGHQRHPAVADAPRRRQTEEEHAEDGAVGVARHAEHEVDDAVVGPVSEGEDQPHQARGQCAVDPPPHAREAALVVALHPIEQVDREGGGQGRERGPGRRIGARDEPHDEQHADEHGQPALDGHQREHLVAARRQRHPAALHIGIEQHAQHQK